MATVEEGVMTSMGPTAFPGMRDLRKSYGDRVVVRGVGMGMAAAILI